MTEFYGFPNSGEFWHWPNALHFVLVGLAGGMALLAALLTLRQDPERHRYTWLAAGLVLLDLLLLWAESPARWRFSHVWLFLSFRPAAPIWWGAWGLALSLAAAALLLLRERLPRLRALPLRALGLLLLLGSLVVLAYPGMALAVNPTRPLWNWAVVPLFLVTALGMALGLASLLGSPWARGWARAAGVLGLILWALYPLTLEAYARGHLYGEAGVGYGLSGLLLLLGLPRGSWGPGVALLGAAGLRWLLVMVGQLQAPGL